MRNLSTQTVPTHETEQQQSPLQISNGSHVNHKAKMLSLCHFVSVRPEGQLDRMLKSGRSSVMNGHSAESNGPLKSSASREIRSGRWSHQSCVAPAPCLTMEPNTPVSTDPLNWLSAGAATKASWQRGYFGAEITLVWTWIEMARAYASALHYREWKTQWGDHFATLQQRATFCSRQLPDANVG